jgi:uncharacterized OB-fold protein
MADIVTEPFDRVLPKITERNRHFWCGGADGRLHILRCQDCGHYLHPPQPMCPRCYSLSLAPEAVSGRGRLYSYTVNHYRWVPGMEPPYVVATVELAEQEGLELMSNLVGCAEAQLRCDLEVEVLFAQHGEVFIPLFRPVEAP